MSDSSMINKLKDSTGDIGNQVKDVTGIASEKMSDLTKTVNKSLDGFSQEGVLNTGKEFLETNGILARFVFIIFVLFAFMFLLNLGMHLIGFFTKSSENPMIVKGKLDGEDGIIISQNPANLDSKTIFRSNNKTGGAEFTWSSWIYLSKSQYDSSSTYYHVFSKGEGIRNGDSTSFKNVKVSNGPGVYVERDPSGLTHMHVIMDTIGEPEDITINTVPINKWFHTAIRMQNKIIDVYINGVVSSRKTLLSMPKQNYHNIAIGGGAAQGGFQGSISNLQYFGYAMNVFEINNIVMKGPNTNSSELSSDSAGKSGNYSYLANMWYKDASS
tara:strand:+ start:1133 stop:2116 length:984 start_codon:yes stop_codon:yes gene_type:complete